MTAEEAKKLSDKLPAKREKIDNAIREAAENGETRLTHWEDEMESTCEDLKTSLEADGFRVSMNYEDRTSDWDSTGKGCFYIHW